MSRIGIKGPGGTPPTGIDEVGRTDEASGASSVERAGEAGKATGAASVGGASGARAVGGADVVTEVARRLRAGELTPREAVELLIDDAVARQVGHRGADRQALAAELKDLLRRYTESDPYLASKVRRLGDK